MKKSLVQPQAPIRVVRLLGARRGPVLSIEDWLKRHIPEPTYLLGNWLSTTSRAMLAGPTGLGKTNFAMAMAFHIAAGVDFLHWKARRQSRVLYIDGEMSRRLYRQRIADAARRIGKKPAGLFFLCRDDVENMPPLNSSDGQQYVDAIIGTIGGVDFIVFDNVMSLLSGGMKDEDSWAEALPWVKDLTKRSIGQLWVHHTGYMEERSYGTSTREWQLDTSIMMNRTGDTVSDISFELKFRKARERTPANRNDFEAKVITLAGEHWSLLETSPRDAIDGQAKRALNILSNLIEHHGKKGIPGVPAGYAAVAEDDWRGACKTERLSEGGDRGARQAFTRAKKELIRQSIIGQHKEFIWLAN